MNDADSLMLFSFIFDREEGVFLIVLIVRRGEAGVYLGDIRVLINLLSQKKTKLRYTRVMLEWNGRGRTYSLQTVRYIHTFCRLGEQIGVSFFLKRL